MKTKHKRLTVYIAALLPSIIITGMSPCLGLMLSEAALSLFLLWGLMAPLIVIVCICLKPISI